MRRAGRQRRLRVTGKLLLIPGKATSPALGIKCPFCQEAHHLEMSSRPNLLRSQTKCGNFQMEKIWPEQSWDFCQWKAAFHLLGTDWLLVLYFGLYFVVGLCPCSTGKTTWSQQRSKVTGKLLLQRADKLEVKSPPRWFNLSNPVVSCRNSEQHQQIKKTSLEKDLEPLAQLSLDNKSHKGKQRKVVSSSICCFTQGLPAWKASLRSLSHSSHDFIPLALLEPVWKVLCPLIYKWVGRSKSPGPQLSKILVFLATRLKFWSPIFQETERSVFPLSPFDSSWHWKIILKED